MPTANAESTGREILRLLTAQNEHYLSLKQVVSRQTGAIRAMDVAGLTSGAAEVRGVMRKVRDLEATIRPVRQSWNNLGRDRSPSEKRRVDALVDSIRNTISEIQLVKDENASLLEKSMHEVRKQMSGLNSQSTAARAYGGPGPATRQPARFIDKSK